MARFLKKLRRARLVAWLLAALIRLLGRTLRWRVVDEAGITVEGARKPVIWVFWHNRVLLMAYARNRYVPASRSVVLTSPSQDGEIIAQVMRRFGVGAVRGSSNKRPAAALMELVRCLRAGIDVGITPDGPRGPRYRFQPGAIKLAQLSQCPLATIHVKYRRAWRFKTWDGFLVPFPFTSAEITFAALRKVPRQMNGEEFNTTRSEMEQLLTDGTGETEVAQSLEAGLTRGAP